MKNFLSPHFKQKISNQIITSVKMDIDCKNHQNKLIGFLHKNNTPFKCLLVMVSAILFAFSTVNAQTVEKLDDYINANPQEAQLIEDLIDGSVSTLFIYGQEFEIKGETTPVIAEVILPSLEELYAFHSEFENIELLRIKVKSMNDLNYKIDFDKLNDFENLKYVYVVITTEVCPENEGNIACQKSKISSMFSVSEGITLPVVLFEIVNLM